MKSIKLVLIAALVFAAASTVWSASTKMNVQVKRGEIRDAPSFLGNPVGHVSYGEQVEVLEQQGAWTRVTAPNGTTGWIHQSALTRKRVPLASGTKDEKVPVSGDELALASKGFDAALEAEFKKRNAHIDFTWVDRMEQIRIPPRKLAVFLKDGGLEPQGGGVP
jgi:SH3-like domain-containing protein